MKSNKLFDSIQNQLLPLSLKDRQDLLNDLLDANQEITELPELLNEIIKEIKDTGKEMSIQESIVSPNWSDDVLFIAFCIDLV